MAGKEAFWPALKAGMQRKGLAEQIIIHCERPETGLFNLKITLLEASGKNGCTFAEAKRA